MVLPWTSHRYLLRAWGALLRHWIRLNLKQMLTRLLLIRVTQRLKHVEVFVDAVSVNLLKDALVLSFMHVF